MKKLLTLFLVVFTATISFADLNDDIWRDGKEYGDADLIEIEDTGGYYTGDNVEDALQEIGDGTTLDDRYVEVAGDTMVGSLIYPDNIRSYYGTASDACIYYDGTNLIIGPEEVGSGKISVNGNYLLPNADGATDGDIIKTDASGTLSWGQPTTQVPIVLSMYDAAPARASETQWNGGIEELAMAETLGTADDIVVINGNGKIVFVVISSDDAIGDVILTGDTINRETGAISVADTDTITFAGNSTDNATTDANGNIVHDYENAYITNKWFTGSVTISTTEVTITDVDVYHVSFEQVNDLPDLILNTFDANIYTTNVNAEFDAYLYTLHVGEGNSMRIDRESELHVGAEGETALVNRHWRLRRGNIAEVLDGTTDGFWVDVHYSNNPAYVEDVTLKVWFTRTVTLDIEAGGKILLETTGDFMLLEDGFFALLEG